ncbi:MAG: aldo/keto reductase [Chloroflexi bacterium HGW-Chloroflexi-10]|nr:MAG: aldo/keto reductase [Chloroflexi bacterium HGW-Chloroflexi-10]
MEYTNLGRTGIKVSRLCLGCMNFGGRQEEGESTRIIHEALDAGINFIDTANVYGHEPLNFDVGRGRSEEIVGRALLGEKREQVILATKVHYPMGDDPNAQGNSRRHIVVQCEASLKRLNTDTIDLYQLHGVNTDIPIDESLRALDDLIRSGKVRYIGTSGFAAWEFLEALWAAKEYHLNRFISEQPPYNLLDRRIERELIPMAQTYGIALFPWAPSAGGFFAAKYQRGQPAPSGSRYEAFWRGFYKEDFSQERVFDVQEAVLSLAQEKQVSGYALALAWCLSRPGITSPIIGPRIPEQLRDSLSAMKITLSKEELDALDAVAPAGSVTVPYIEYQGAHPFRW